MNIALLKNNECVNVVIVDNIELAEELFGNDYEIINADIPINQDFENQKVSIGMKKQENGTWFDPSFVIWNPPT